jgi:formylmethanofuran dehydrogenase subunit B
MALTWQTGFPMAVDFSRGAPRYQPEDATLPRLARGAIDAALIVGATTALPTAVTDTLRDVRTMVIGPRASESAIAASIRIDTGVASIHESGIAFRTDDLPLPLRALLPTPRDTASLLKALGAAIAAHRAHGTGATVHTPASSAPSSPSPPRPAPPPSPGADSTAPKT